MATTRCDFYWLYKRLTATLNASIASSFTPTLDDPRRSPGELFSSLQAADDEVCTLIAETQGHPYRPLFLSESSDLSHGDALPEHLGPLAQVRIKYVSSDSDYKAGKFDKDLSLADIERWRKNSGTIYGVAHDAANSVLSGFYMEFPEELFFTGYRAKVRFATYTRNSREVTDAEMTINLKPLTSATAVFTSGDAGGAVLVEGAGPAGNALVSRIDTFTSSTVVALRDAATASVSAKAAVIAKLQSPQAYEDAVLALAALRAVKRGDNQSFAELNFRAVESYRGRIKAGEQTIPKLEIAQAA